MPSYNRVLLMGNLTRDPELRYLPSNMPVVAIGLAVNRKWKNQQGEAQEEVTFVDCEAFGRTAELINQYIKKGRPIFVEGRLKLDQWQDKEGQNRSKLKVIIENFQFVDSRGGAEGGDMDGSAPTGASRSNPRPATRPSGPPSAVPAAPSESSDPHQAVNEDDIPF